MFDFNDDSEEDNTEKPTPKINFHDPYYDGKYYFSVEELITYLGQYKETFQIHQETEKDTIKQLSDGLVECIQSLKGQKIIEEIESEIPMPKSSSGSIFKTDNLKFIYDENQIESYFASNGHLYFGYDKVIDFDSNKERYNKWLENYKDWKKKQKDNEK